MGFGACYILLPNFFIKNIKLDDFLFLMGEEAMLANQVISSGGRTYYDVELKVFHLDNATFKSLPLLTTYRFNQESYKKSKKVYKYADIFDGEIESNNNF
jgi:GT2 family glycosyltransferase